jgi:hypothetical protein
LTCFIKYDIIILSKQREENIMRITTIEDGIINLKPLKGRVPSDFCEAVATLTRPYIAISKEVYEKVFNEGSDYFKYKEKVVTFGTADGGYALMPLQSKYANKILDKN